MKNHNNDKKILAPVLAIVILLVIAFFSIRALSNLGKEFNEKNLSDINDEKVQDSGLENKQLPEQKDNSTEQVKTTEEQKDSGCVWKTIDREVPTYILDEEKTIVTEKKILNYTYPFEIIDEPERSIKKTIDTKSYDAFTTYDKKEFEGFYSDFVLKGWFIDTGISKYESTNSDSSFKIRNTGNTTGSYNILRVYTTEKDNRYYDEKPTSVKMEIKAGDEKTIKFDDSVICYMIGTVNESDKNQQIILMKDFMKKRPYGISQEDFVIFPSSGKNIACARPYFIIIPDTYQKEYTNSEEVTRQYYRTTTKHTQEIICE